MEITAITLNIENWHLLIVFIIMIGGAFGQPYAVRAINKKNQDLKADKTELVKLEKEVKLKADKIELEKLEKEVKLKASTKELEKEIGGVYHKVNDVKGDVQYLRKKSDAIYTILIEMKGKKLN